MRGRTITSNGLSEQLDQLVEFSTSTEKASFRGLVHKAGLDPKRDFVGASLREIDLRDEDLSGFNFSGADLTGADFRRAKLRRTSFSSAILTGAIGLPPMLWHDRSKYEALWGAVPLIPMPSRIDTGAFAAEDLDAGTIVIPSWHEAFYEGMEGWVRLDRRQVRKLPRDQKKLFLRYGRDQDFDQIVGPVDIRYVTTPDNFINHSCDPNLCYDVSGNVIAARRIAKGEEVYIDYGCFIVNFDEPFDCACGSHNCRGRIRRQDWKKLAVTYGMKMPRFLHSRIARALQNEREPRRYSRSPASLDSGDESPDTQGKTNRVR